MLKGDLGTHDGPPIRECREGENLKFSAIHGSMALLVALERTGQRP
jgi:hypothetical protein